MFAEKLYHGTTETVWKRIVSDGALTPRRDHGKSNWDHTCASHPDAIYLTSTYAPYFGIVALDQDDLVDDGARVAVIEIDVRAVMGHLVPDEDMLEQSTRTNKFKRTHMKGRTAIARSMMGKMVGTGNWMTSLDWMGTCAHMGPIPLSAVSRVALVDIQKEARWAWECMNPSITNLNYKFCGDRYRQLTADSFNLPSGEVIVF